MRAVESHDGVQQVIGSRLTLAAAAFAALSAAPRGPASTPADPIAGILGAFRTHAIVAFGEVHGEEQGHAFRLALIRDPRFPGLVNDIVVEYGNARYQAAVDRFTAGGDVPYETLRQVWQNTTIPDAIWDRPIYEEFFQAVRAVNAALPVEKRIRVLLGDPPIDWSNVNTVADFRRDWGRVTHPAEVTRREVLARNRRALLVYGAGHLWRQHVAGVTLVDRLDAIAPGQVFTVMTHPGANVAVVQPEEELEQVPALLLTRGTSLENQVDAVLYLGPASSLTHSRLSAGLCADDSYREMRVRRMALSFGTEAAAAGALDAECRAQAAGVPDFTGTWKHANAGQSLPEPPPPPPVPPRGLAAPPPPPPPLRTVQLKISQTAAEIRIERTAAGPDRNTVTVSVYKLDGTESINQMGPILATTRAAWEGPSLVLSTTYRAGEKALGDGRETLALDGATMVVEYTRNLPVGRVSGKDLYVKDR